MNTLDLLKKGSKILKSNKIQSFRLDSEILLSEILKKDRQEILQNLNQNIYKDQILKYSELIDRRSGHEPVAYILNKKEFWSKFFYVNTDTLIPRPETELMVDQLIKKYKNKENISILDVGTGSGCIIISLLSELSNSYGVGIDISSKAIEISKKNAIKHGVENKIKFFHTSLSQYFNKKFDLVVSNPPYVKRREIQNLSDDIKKYEPRIALDGGNDGLDLIKKVIYKTNEILKLNGTLALEIGNKQFKEVSKHIK
jgi:protein-(glutamine-N5) methyltransferase, release factor-specific